MKTIWNLLFILILGSFFAFLLSEIEDWTLPKIEKNKKQKLRAVVLEASGIDYEMNNTDEMFQIFDKNIRKKTIKTPDSEFVYYLSPDNLYIFEFEGTGLWGIIEGVIALNPDQKTIEKIRIISQEETPGLGGRIGEEEILDRFKKKLYPLTLRTRRKATKNDEVDAITGATMTSQAVVNMINETIKNFRKVTGG